MKAQVKLAKIALLLFTVIHQPSTCLSQGALTPSGAPAPTMKSLAQIEPRTLISSAPFTITNPGAYYLTGNLTVSSGNAIVIATNGVTLDLNGFTLASTENPATSGYAILLNNGLSDITIANGHIRGGVTTNSGIYSGSGFGYGIGAPGADTVNARVFSVSVSGCQYNGISLGFNSTVVEACTVRTVGGFGILADTVKSSAATVCGDAAIDGNQVSDCHGQSSGGDGINAQVVQNCYGIGSGIYAGVYAYTANNCYGTSGNGGFGVYATTANNCYGYCPSGNGNCYGVWVSGTATGCYGYSSGGSGGAGVYARTVNNCYGYDSGSGYGVLAQTAMGCNGSSVSGIGIWAQNAINCYAETSTGSYGLWANRTAIGCYGSSGTGTGLHAWIANSCDGNSFNVLNKYNMP